MQEENGIVKYNPENYKQAWIKAFADNLVKKGFSPTQIGALYMHDYKSKVLKTLSEKELEAQKILLDAGTEDIKKIEDSLASYRKFFTEVDDTIRKTYTSHVKEKYMDPATEITKRMDYSTNVEYFKLSTLLLTLKRDFEKKQREANEKQKEKVLYLNHVKNETINRESEYKTAVTKELNTMYAFFLENKDENPDIQAVKDTIAGIKIRDAVKYNRVLISDVEATELVKELFKSTPNINKEKLMQESIALVDAKFKLYENDLAQVKNKPEIVNEIKTIAQQEINSISESAKLKTSVNSMVASSENIPVIIPEHKAIKKKLVVVDENTEQWHINVIAAYLRSPDVRQYMKKRKRFGTIDVDSMAAALGEYATENPENKVDSLKYEEIEK